MRSAALLEARARGAQVFPIASVEWTARGLDLGRGLYSPAVRVTSLGQVTAVTKQGGGFDEIVYGSGIEKSMLDAVRTSVDVSDPERTLIRMLETYDPRGSAARIDQGAPDLVAADWEPCFVGIVEDWERDGLYTKLLLKTDDTVLRTPVPPTVFSRTEWGSANDSTIFGTACPLVLGIHDSFAITARGMVPAVNVRYDKDLGRWWWASGNYMVEIRRIYFDGIAQPDTIWTTLRGVFGKNVATIIVITEGSQPEKNVVVSFDCEAVNVNGTAEVGPAILTNPVTQLRVILEEYIYRDPPLGAWRGPHAIIDATSWDAAEAWFAAHGYESARRLGGDQNPQSGAELIGSFLDGFPFVRIHWTPLGTLEFVIIDPDDVTPDPSAWLELDRHQEGGQVAYAAGDRREVYTHLNLPYMWSPAEQKFMGALAVQDVAALPEKVALELPNVWTQGRYLQD